MSELSPKAEALRQTLRMALDPHPPTDAVPVMTMTDKHAVAIFAAVGEILIQVETDKLQYPSVFNAKLLTEVTVVIDNLASGALRTFDPQRQVAVPREDLQTGSGWMQEVLKEYGRIGGRRYTLRLLDEAFTRWLTDKNV